MYVDPLLLSVMLILLVGTSGLAAVLYVRYRRCEDVYQAYGRARMEAAPTPQPDAERYVTGADYAAMPELNVPLPAPVPTIEEVPSVPEEEPVMAPPPDSPEGAGQLNEAEHLSAWPAQSDELPFVPEALQWEDEPPAPAPAETLFYEYTAQGFVPVDLRAPAEEAEVPPPAEEAAGDDVRSTVAPVDLPPAEEARPPRVEAVRPPVVATPPPAEDGFVWL